MISEVSEKATFWEKVVWRQRGATCATRHAPDCAARGGSSRGNFGKFLPGVAALQSIPHNFLRGLLALRVRVRDKGVASYLLVAALPGEVQEAGGEQLVFGPGTAVHVAPCRAEESVTNGDSVKTTTACVFSPPASVSAPLAPLSSPCPRGAAEEAVRRAAAAEGGGGGGVSGAAASPVTWAPSPKKQSGMLCKVAAAPKVGSADQEAPTAQGAMFPRPSTAK